MALQKRLPNRAIGWAAAMAATSILLAFAPAPGRAQSRSSFSAVVDTVQPKIVKIYGAGGLQRMEAYQSGFLVSAEGHVVTAWTHVLDTDQITATLDDGRKFEATLLGADPRMDVAVLKIDAEELPHFPLAEAADVNVGSRVLAFSNLFGVATGNEPASVLHGSVSAVTSLAARSGVYNIPYHGTVYVVDAITNNPGAAGGVLTDRQGQLVGMLGRELRHATSNVWLNYALPVAAFAPSVRGIIADEVLPLGDAQRVKPLRSLTLAQLGIVLVPDILSRTPPFIDTVRAGSLAQAAGLNPDDLVVFLNGRLVSSCTILLDEIQYLEYDANVSLTVMRGNELIEVAFDPIVEK